MIREDPLFVANRDSNRVEVLHTAQKELGTPIGVAGGPVDVVVTRRGGPTGPERAYVLTIDSAQVARIDVATMIPVSPPVELELEPPFMPVAIAARSDGFFLFTANFFHGSFTVVNIDPIFPVPVNAGEFTAGPTVRRLVLLPVP